MHYWRPLEYWQTMPDGCSRPDELVAMTALGAVVTEVKTDGREGLLRFSGTGGEEWFL